MDSSVSVQSTKVGPVAFFSVRDAFGTWQSASKTHRKAHPKLSLFRMKKKRGKKKHWNALKCIKNTHAEIMV